MINYNYIVDFQIVNENIYSIWLASVLKGELYNQGEINYIFCDDDYLLQINQNYLNHNTYTDIITFDYTEGTSISGDIYISVERVRENAVTFGVAFDNELRRVMVHGVLHLMGYKDKSNSEAAKMRAKEDEKMNLFHVEQ